jgi:hypothetical protein
MTMPQIFVLDVPEFSALVTQAQGRADCRVVGPRLGYWRIASDRPLEFRRKELGFKPAVWHGALTGGLVGHITHFDNDLLRIEEAVE